MFSSWKLERIWIVRRFAAASVWLYRDSREADGMLVNASDTAADTSWVRARRVRSSECKSWEVSEVLSVAEDSVALRWSVISSTAESRDKIWVAKEGSILRFLF